MQFKFQNPKLSTITTDLLPITIAHYSIILKVSKLLEIYRSDFFMGQMPLVSPNEEECQSRAIYIIYNNNIKGEMRSHS